MTRNQKVPRELKAIAEEAERTRDLPMSKNAKFTKPNQSIPVAVRLTPTDVAAIEELAGKLDLPSSALLRGWIVGGLNATREDSVATALDRIESDVQRLRQLVV